MEVDRSEHSKLLKQFANVLFAYQSLELGNYQNQDPFHLVQEFRSIAGEAALESIPDEEEDQNKGVFTNFELEAKLWYLVELLISFRTSDDSLEEVNARDYHSNAVFKKELLQQDRSLYEIWLLIAWLQENLQLPARPEKFPTTKWAQSMLSGEVKSSDLDYPLREDAVRLNSKDLDEDRTFYKYIYELVLAGQFEQVRRECEYSDNLTLSMIMCGLEDYVDPKKDLEVGGEYETQQGIKKRALWRRAVYALAQNPKIDKYEAAIYMFLAGGIPKTIEEESSNWEKELLVYLNEIWNITIENYLLERGRIDSSELISVMPSQPLTLLNVLNIVAAKHPEESQHPIRVLMGSVMMNTMDSVVKSFNNMLLDVVKGIESEDELTIEPYLLRILTHLSIFLDKACPGMLDEVDTSKLITAYVTLLTLYGHFELVPVYVSFLRQSDAMEAYSYFLSNLSDREARAKQLELSNFLQLPTADILRRTAQRIFNDTEYHYSPQEVITVNTDVSEVDKHLMLAVNWLVEGKLYIDSVESIIALCRRFLINGKVGALESFFDGHSINTIIKNYELDQLAAKEDNPVDKHAQEIEQYSSLIAVMKKHRNWEAAASASNAETNIPALLKQFQDLAASLRTIVTQFLADFTDDSKSSDPDNVILYGIRSLYTPYLLTMLHTSYVDAASKFNIKSFIQEAVNLSVLVASETFKIYLLFQSSGKLKEYLQLVAKAVAMLGH